MKEKTFDFFLWIATLGLIIGSFFLPNEVPLHWDSSWQIDRYGSRYEFLLIALLPIAFYYGLLLAMKIDPKRMNFQSREKTYNFLRKSISGFLVVFCGCIYYITLNPSTDGKLVICVMLGCVFILLGNYMPKLPQNFSIGIRTPWTISNEEVWRKTQKLGGYSFVLSGIVIVIWGIFNLPYMTSVMIVLIVLMTVIVCVYSYVIYKKIESK